MPTREQHVRKAEENAGFALSLPLDKQVRIDWALVALFYAALHYVEAYLDPAHLRTHEQRDKYFARDANLRKIYNEYGHLKYFGYNARYEVAGFTSKDVTTEAATDFASIKAHLTPLL